MEATKERYNVLQHISKELLQDMDQTDLEGELAYFGDDKLTRDGGTRVSDWTWEHIIEDQATFQSRIYDLTQRIGQPWEDGLPWDASTPETEADDVHPATIIVDGVEYDRADAQPVPLPPDVITAEAVEYIRAQGPEHFMLGKCWAVRA